MDLRPQRRLRTGDLRPPAHRRRELKIGSFDFSSLELMTPAIRAYPLAVSFKWRAHVESESALVGVRATRIDRVRVLDGHPANHGQATDRTAGSIRPHPAARPEQRRPELHERRRQYSAGRTDFRRNSHRPPLRGGLRDLQEQEARSMDRGDAADHRTQWGP